MVTGTCGTPQTSSISGAFIVNDVSVAGTITGLNYTCDGKAAPLLTLSGQTGSVLKWQSSSYLNSTWTTFTDIANTTTTYSPGVLSDTMKFRVSVKNGACASVFSATKQLNYRLNPTFTTGSITSPTCFNDSITFEADGLLPNVTNIIYYTANYDVTTTHATKSVVSSPTGSASFKGAGYTPNYYSFIVDSIYVQGCTTPYTGVVGYFTVNPLPTASIIGTTSVCKDASAPNITFTGAGGTAPYTFTYKLNNGSDLTVATTTGNSVTLSAPTLAAGTYTYTLVSVADVNCSQTQTGDATITVDPLPTLNTSAITTFNATSATMGGDVTADNGAAVIEKGVVFSSTNTTPTIGGTDVTLNVNGSIGTGSFNKSISGLASSTTYYVRAYASNSSCTSYGSVTSFTTLCANPHVHLYRSSSLIDDYCTIQAAINASIDGDVINVDAGTYTEQLTITKGITLQGAGRDITIIQSPDSNLLVINGGNWKNLKNQDMFDVIGIKATNEVPVIIKDLKIDGRNQGILPDQLYPNRNMYDFHAIGAYNTTVTVDNVYVTGIRELASSLGQFTPAGYLPTDQPSGMNHNDAVFAESRLGANPHTFTLTNSYITKFEKTAVLAWGPTLTVNINNNIIQGYGQTLWSTGNGIQIASSDRTGSGGENGDRRGTKGSITNNQILDIGLVIPEPGDPQSYLNLGLLSPSGILLWEAGDNFMISNNIISRNIKTKSWHVDATSTDGGYGSMGIDVVSSNNTIISNNTVDGYDEGIGNEIYITNGRIVTTNNIVANNTIDYMLNPGPNTINLNSSHETLTYYSNSTGNDTITNFGVHDRIQVIKLDQDVVNGFLGTQPSINYTGGTVTNGNGTAVAPYSMQIHYDGTHTYLYIDTDGQLGQAELVLLLNGEYRTTNFLLDSSFIKYQIAAPYNQAINLNFTNVMTDKMNINWTRGSGDSCLVFIYEGSIGTASPVDNVYYKADSVFKNGDQIGTSGWYCVYRGTGTSKTITGLTPHTTYRIHVCEFNYGSYHYNSDSTANNPKNQSTCTNPTNGGIISGNQSICHGDSPSQITSSTLPSGQTGTIEYQWQSSNDSILFTDLASGTYTSTSYTPTSITTTTWFRRLSRVGCMSDWTNATSSNVVKITYYNSFAPGAIATIGQTICYNGDPSLIGSTTAASGGNDTITYEWYKSTTSFADSTLIGSNTAIYDPPTGLTQTTAYRRYAHEGKCNTSFKVSIGTWIVTVNPLPTATISGTTDVCKDATAPLVTFTGANGTAPYTFTYKINGCSDQTIATTSGNSVTIAAPTSLVGTYTYTLESIQDASITTCSQNQAGSAVITVNVLPTPTISGSNSICNFTTGNVYTTEAGMTTYSWSVNGGTITSGGTATDNTATITWTTSGAKSVSVNYTNTYGCVIASATVYNVTVNPAPTPLITGSPNDGYYVHCTNINTYCTPYVAGHLYSWSGFGTVTVTNPSQGNCIEDTFINPCGVYGAWPIIVTETNPTSGCSTTYTKNVYIQTN